MSITLTWPVLGLIMIFIGIFGASWLVKLNSTVVDAFMWILGALLFIVVLISVLSRLFH